jgi:hypothetical protein
LKQLKAGNLIIKKKEEKKNKALVRFYKALLFRDRDKQKDTN